MATMQRALTRVNVELKYSEGFNPHPYLSAALPLSVGQGSLCELLDIETVSTPSLTRLPEIINAALPEGLEVLEAYTPERKFILITWLEIHGMLYYDKGLPGDAVKRLTERFQTESIVITKKTKRGTSDVDIAPFIRDIQFYDMDGVNIKAKVSAQNPAVSAQNLMSALEGEYSDLAPDFTMFTRIEVFDNEMRRFR